MEEEGLKEEERYDIEKRYQLYLKQVQLKEENMNPIQRREMRRAFMAGAGSMFVLVHEEQSNQTPEEHARRLVETRDQLIAFWNEQE